MRPNLYTFLFLFCFSVSAFSQSTFRLVFYNVENLFDTEDNPSKNDNEFLPNGTRKWTQGRYRNKINNLAKVISSVGEWGYPALVGLCEVENEKVLTDLTSYSPLREAAYRFIITDSPDPRGINTALLYQRDRFKYISHQAYRINYPYNKNKRTRDILHVAGEVQSGDTLDLFVCHFPSRRGGAEKSEQDRFFVAGILKSKADSIMSVRSCPNIIIMGDFNDEPFDKSISEVLKAKPLDSNIEKRGLYNLFYHYGKRKNEGSYKFGKYWNVLDQIIVSGNLIDSTEKNVKILPYTATIFQRNFMMKSDETYGGKRLKKTFHGYKYEGGYSDHLPIFVDFQSIEN